MSKPTHTALEVANYFLLKAQNDEELLSNLKLQKLIYYAQGLHLIFFGQSLFKEKIRAWTYGPVVPELYFFFKDYGASGILPPKSFKPTFIDEETRSFLDEIYEVFGQFSAPRLLELTHTDQCWRDAHPNGIITHKAMRESLRKYIIIDEEEG